MADRKRDFIIPEEIQRRIAAGEYIRFGNVVRDKKGRFVQLLTSQQGAAARKAKTKSDLMGAGLSLGIALGLGIYEWVRNRREDERKTPPKDPEA
jgi:hypothetical protein